MKRSIIWKGMKRELAKHACVLAAARLHGPALAKFASPEELLQALKKPASKAEHDELLAALVAEQQARPHALWQALLLLAFEPMLCGLRWRLHEPGDEDLDQEVVLAFLEAVRSLDVGAVGPFLVLALRRSTSKIVGTRLPGRGADETFDEEAHSADESSPKHDERETARAVLGASSPELAQALVAVTESGESLSEYVERTSGGVPRRERTARYRRLLRERERVAREVGRAA